MRPTLGKKSSQPLKCAICERVFTRSEHLKRHMAIHDKTKPFVCKYCGKSFGRKDAAHRHEQGHLDFTPAVTESAASSSICRTCTTCAKARVRCSGHMPCQLCRTKELECIYRPRKRRRRLYSPSGRNSIPDADTTELSTSVTPSHVGEDIVTLGEDQGSYSDSAANPVSPEADAMPRPDPVNWLPFRRLNADDSVRLSSQAQDLSEHSFEVDGIADSVLVGGEGPLGAGHTIPVPPLMDASAQQHDQFSALIASMLTTPAVVDQESLSTHSGGSRIGRLYADGTGARESRMGRRASHRFTPTTAPWTSNTLLLDSSWKTILREKIAARGSQGSKSVKISQEVYAELMMKITNFLSQSTYSVDYFTNGDDLVAMDTWNYLMQLYFENFHPIYPFLDHSLLALPTWGWALCLATATMGARYTAIAELVTYGEILSKVLYDILLREVEMGPVDDSLPFLQARAIALISLCQSRQYDLMDMGNTASAMVCNSSLRLRLFSEDHRIGEFRQGQTAEQAWIAWRFRETRRRTAFFILTTVANLAFVRGISPQLNLENTSLLLPSSEGLWQAETCHQWFQCRTGDGTVTLDPTQFRSEENSRAFLQDVLRRLWVDTSLQPSMSPFIVETVIHMLIRRTWYAQQYLGDPLYSWSRTEDLDPCFHPSNRQASCYPGSNPDFARWRNATCDCLDVIHWDALSMSARACGYESTIFLSLHLSRLLLLTPVKELLAFAYECAGHPSNWVLPHSLYASGLYKNENSSSAVMTWWFQDRYKARLALVHAGAMFWHVRRYASNSHMQPYAVYLATVVLWAYGTCANRYLSRIAPVTAEHHDQSVDQPLDLSLERQMLEQHMVGLTPPICPDVVDVSEIQGDARMPSQMQLDRPIDDELVQFFIRHGSVRLFLEGVPNLCGVKGPLQVLQEGCEILQQSVDTWTITERYVHSLRDIARSENVMSQP